jgi:hypothetical protein
VPDDLELVAAALFDGGAEETPRDSLVAGAEGVFLARARDRALLALPRGGGTARTLLTLDSPARGVALSSGSLWVTRRGTGGGTVERIALPGGQLSTVTKGLGAPAALACDGEALFVVDVDAGDGGLLPRSSVIRIPVKGGAGTVLGTTEGPIDSVALDGDFVYWADPLEGAVLQVPKTGGKPHPIASDRGLPEKLVAYGGALYWVERRSESLWTMPASGGQPRRVTHDFAGFAHLAPDRRGIWWTSEEPVDGTFRVLGAAGGSPEGEHPVSDGVPAIDALASDGDTLYWDLDGEVSVVKGP